MQASQQGRDEGGREEVKASSVSVSSPKPYGIVQMRAEPWDEREPQVGIYLDDR